MAVGIVKDSDVGLRPKLVEVICYPKIVIVNIKLVSPFLAPSQTHSNARAQQIANIKPMMIAENSIRRTRYPGGHD
jgi:hypothetical protein